MKILNQSLLTKSDPRQIRRAPNAMSDWTNESVINRRGVTPFCTNKGGVRLVTIALSLCMTLGSFATAHAGAVRAGFTDFVLVANDDGSTPLVPIGFTVNFGGQGYMDLFVNNNGNITFDTALGEFTPQPIGASGHVMIAPYWGDVDTRDPGSNEVSYGYGTVDGRNAFGINWGSVGYFNAHADKLNTFQLVLIDRSDRALGDFDFEFNYDQVQWETGDASGGVDGFGGFSARAGFSTGTGISGELEGSGQNGAFLDSNLSTGLIYNSRDSMQLGRYRFAVQGGSALPLQSAVSRKTHGAQDFDVLLAPLVTPGIECRTGGANNDYQIIFDFDTTVTFDDAAVTSGIGMVSSTSGSGTTSVTVDLTGVGNEQTITVSLLGVNDGTNSQNVAVQMSILLGDTTGNRAVNSSDIAQTKSRSGQSITPTNFRGDVTSDGMINSSDIALVKSTSGTGINNALELVRASSNAAIRNKHRQGRARH